jgi:hypothetical protein
MIQEYIRVIDDSAVSKSSRGGAQAKDAGDSKQTSSQRNIIEGIRVHVKISDKNGRCKYFPGRVVKAYKGDIFDCIPSNILSY